MAGSVVVGVIHEESASFTRPADTTAYASGDLIANSTTAADVAPMSWPAARGPGNSFMVRRARLFKDDDDTANASFRLHLFKSDPTATAPSNGDNGAIQLTGVLTDYLGSMDFDASLIDITTDGNTAIGVPEVGSEINCRLANGSTIYGLLEARAAYTPASGETFTVVLELMQN